MENIILIGMPGSGKSTLGKILSQRVGFTFIDFDDDILESSKGKNVGELVNALSQKDFIKHEEELCLKLNFKNTVFSTSGSLPYSKKSMIHLKSLGTIVYLKVDISEIITRMGDMKTERIIGLKNNDFKLLFYEREKLYIDSADIIFDYSGTDIQKITQDLLNIIQGKN